MKYCSHAGLVNRILLGLVFLVSGLMKLFVMGPDAVTGMLGGMALFAWAPAFFAWVLILCEIVFGLAVIVGWKLNYTVWPLIVIMVVATFTAHWGNWGNMLIHLTLASNLLMISGCCGSCCASDQMKMMDKKMKK